MLLRTWRKKDEKKCHFCSLKETDKYAWEVESTGELPEENWKRSVQTDVKLIELTRDFSKNDRVVYHICSQCELLLLLDEVRASYRYGFRIPGPEAKKEEASVETEAIERKEEGSGEEKEEQKVQEKMEIKEE